MNRIHNKNIDNVIIYGNKLNKNNISKMFECFYNAFKFLKYNTIWISDEEKSILNNFDFRNTIIIVSGYENKYVPINNHCFYVLYDCQDDKFNIIDNNNKFKLIEYYDGINTDGFCSKIGNDFVYYKINQEYELIMPWATELLPYQIDKNINNLKNIKLNNNGYIYRFATKNELSLINNFKRLCFSDNRKFRMNYRYMEQKLSYEKNIKECFYPLVLCDKITNKKIDIDIFKIISYGNLPVTNSKVGNDFFNKKLTYSPNLETLYKKRNSYNIQDKYDVLIDLMNIVKKKHTCLNRTFNILEYIFFIKNQNN
jgi:hypothetical protein